MRNRAEEFPASSVGQKKGYYDCSPGLESRKLKNITGGESRLVSLSLGAYAQLPPSSTPHRFSLITYSV